MKWADPYNALVVAKYREVAALAPPQVQGPLAAAEAFIDQLWAGQDPRVKVTTKTKSETGVYG